MTHFLFQVSRQQEHQMLNGTLTHYTRSDCPNCSFSCIQNPFHSFLQSTWPSFHQFPFLSPWSTSVKVSNNSVDLRSSVMAISSRQSDVKWTVDHAIRWWTCPASWRYDSWERSISLRSPGNTWVGIRGPIFCDSCGINVCSCNRSNTLPDNPW